MEDHLGLLVVSLDLLLLRDACDPQGRGEWRLHLSRVPCGVPL